MPRISAETIPEHVARQRAAVLDAAAELFAASGVDAVSLGDIAASVGLARNSLYRYFPDKSHIVMAWFHSEIEPLRLGGEQIVTTDAPPHEQLERWVILHFDYLSQPIHHMMISAVASSSVVTDQTHEQIVQGHEELYRPLKQILARLSSVRADPEWTLDVDVTVALTVGMIRSAAQLVVDEGMDDSRVRRSLLATLHAATH